MGDPSGVIHIPDVDPIELVVKENTGGTDKWSLASMGALQVPPHEYLRWPKGPQNTPKLTKSEKLELILKKTWI